MNEQALSIFKRWFNAYTESFYTDNREDQKNIMVKVQHTRHVCRNIVEIAERLNLSTDQTLIAETIALFHDLGRFPQYRRYKTFKDVASISHGRLGAETLIKEKILDELPVEEQNLILHCVRFHGAFELPSTTEPEALLFLKLIRDADKIDIFRVFIEYYESPEDERASATAFGLGDSSTYSASIIASIQKRKVASYKALRTECDFKLLKLTWVYALYFEPSLAMLCERGYLASILNKLPETREILSAVSSIEEYISTRLQSRFSLRHSP